jgi:hypothetical protein
MGASNWVPVSMLWCQFLVSLPLGFRCTAVRERADRCARKGRQTAEIATFCVTPAFCCNLLRMDFQVATLKSSLAIPHDFTDQYSPGKN